MFYIHKFQQKYQTINQSYNLYLKCSSCSSVTMFGLSLTPLYQHTGIVYLMSISILTEHRIYTLVLIPEVFTISVWTRYSNIAF